MLKEIIISILENGNKSPCLDEFIRICLKISYVCFIKSRYKDFICSETGLSCKDFAWDAIADLFKETNGKYLYFEKHFTKGNKKIYELSEEYIDAKLNAIVISRTTQRIREIRESDCNEIYLKIKDAVRLHISRKSGLISSLIYNKNEYYYTCNIKKLNCIEDEIPVEILVEEIFKVTNKITKISAITELVFQILNQQNIYSKAISEINLINSITEYFNRRLKDYKSNNVHYIYNEEAL